MRRVEPLDEDYVDEIVTLGETVTLLYTGLDLAMARARSAYVAGRMPVEEFEREVDRLLHKRVELSRRAQ